MDGLPNVLAEDEMEWLGRVGFLNDPGGPGIVLDCMSVAIVKVWVCGKVASDNWTGVFCRLQLHLQCRLFADAN